MSATDAECAENAVRNSVCQAEKKENNRKLPVPSDKSSDGIFLN